VHPFAEEKLALAEALCGDLGYDWPRVTAYADSIADLPLLGRVGKAVVVCPDARIAAVAQRRRWETITIPARAARDARLGSVQPGVHSGSGTGVAPVVPVDRKL
jgi:phosphoserine phosphatase